MTIKAEADPGEHITEAIAEASRFANASGQPIELTFNGIEIICRPNSNKNDLELIYSLRLSLVQAHKETK